MATTSTSANEEQERFWNEVMGPLWVASEEENESHTGPFGDAALAVAAPAAGEAVLDVGCGCGSTTLTLAAAVGASGRVLGVDLSAVMLARALARADQADAAEVELRRVDAQSADLGAVSFDLVFSRFGVMFFADAVAGFANLHRALRSSGRLAFVCWQDPSVNPWMAVVNRAAAQIFDLQAPAQDGPGPFSLADPARIAGVLDASGFGSVEITGCHHKMRLGVGERVEDWVHQRLLMGPARSPYLAAGKDRQQRARASVAAILARYQVEGDDPLRGLSMDAAAWIVSARP